MRGPSYYKIRWQLSSFWRKNYFSTNFTRKKLANIAKKSNKHKKKKLIKFISNIELTLSSLLLRTRILNTSGIAHQFIKHGNVYINYNKIRSPSYVVQPGDTISMFINPKQQKYHRFNDPLYTHRSVHGLYRRNTGRQSLTARDKATLFIKTSLNKFSN
jgi:ribosomal protein S4